MRSVIKQRRVVYVFSVAQETGFLKIHSGYLFLDIMNQ